MADKPLTPEEQALEFAMLALDADPHILNRLREQNEQQAARLAVFEADSKRQVELIRRLYNELATNIDEMTALDKQIRRLTRQIKRLTKENARLLTFAAE